MMNLFNFSRPSSSTSYPDIGTIAILIIVIILLIIGILLGLLGITRKNFSKKESNQAMDTDDRHYEWQSNNDDSVNKEECQDIRTDGEESYGSTDEQEFTQSPTDTSSRSCKNLQYNSETNAVPSPSPLHRLEDRPSSITHSPRLNQNQENSHHPTRKTVKKNRYVIIAEGLRRGIASFGDVKNAPNRDPLIVSSNKDDSYFPGCVADVIVHENLTIGVVAVRGLSHEENKKVRQDSVAFGVSADGRYLIGSIADGVSEAEFSHKGSYYATQKIVKSIRKKLDEGFHPENLPWEDITNHVRNELRARGKRTFKITEDVQDQELDSQLAKVIGTTAEVLIIDSKKINDQVSCIRASLAGDGYSFIISNDSMTLLGSGKETPSGDFVLNEKVRALPKDPGPKYPLINQVTISKNEAIFITSDGIGDDISKPDLGIDAYLCDKLAKPVPAYELLKITSYLAFQSHDDRSMIIVWA
jgi:hypothetical protein